MSNCVDYKFPEGYEPPDSWMQQELNTLANQNRFRQLKQAELLPGGRITLNGRAMLNLCSNDYLGLIERFPTPPLASGSGASRLVCGNHQQLQDLEQLLADLHSTEECLIFGSGFLANLGVISAITGRNDIIFSDKLNHASIVDGATLSRAKHIRYRHNDMEHLEFLLKQHPGAQRKLIVSDTVFSMDGDCAPVKDLVELKYRHGAILMLDEAHSGGVVGPKGAGLAAEQGIASHIDIHMGTLSKAFACYGAYVCVSNTIKHYLINRARSLVYSTSLPPALAAAAIKNTTYIMTADAERRQLKINSDLFRTKLIHYGLDCGTGSTQIVPVMLGDESRALTVSNRLQNEGIAAVAIRPPTVPENAARIRFSVMATHEEKDLLAAAKTIAEFSR